MESLPPLDATLQAPSPAAARAEDLTIQVRDLVVSFGDKLVMNGLDLDVFRGEVLGVVGGSGTGKSVLMRTILGLIAKQRGTIQLFGADLEQLDINERKRLERRFGVMFQQGALFSGLTVKQNVQVPLREHLNMSKRLADELAMLKIELVGLDPDAANKHPAELSGGMVKRAALARALALDPELVFLDEPTSGLDPIGAAEFDELISTLQKTLGLTVFMVTHDLDSLYAACDKVAALADGKVIASGPISAMLASEHPWLRAYFHGNRARQSDLRARARPKGQPPALRTT
jgi:phospholipid/cholesterol/gamma-HCH transport system ATP-binding protein